jgi:hypothetical protein
MITNVSDGSPLYSFKLEVLALKTEAACAPGTFAISHNTTVSKPRKPQHKLPCLDQIIDTDNE